VAAPGEASRGLTRKLPVMRSKPVSRLWRKYRRLSVRGLIVLVLVIGAGMGWLVRSARIQREAVGAIKKEGGGVRYNWESSDGVLIPGGKPWAPRWLVDCVGVDYFGHVVDVAVSLFSKSPDATVEQAGRLTRLTLLRLNQTPLTDAGLAHVKGLNDLVYLDLTGTEVTDAGLAHLTGLSKLSYLQLTRTHVTDGGVNKLHQALPNLTIVR
jgi:hypothetical protein